MKEKTENNNSRFHLWPYFQSIPGILYYQVVSSIILTVIMYFIRMLSALLISSAGHAAVTSGDYKFLFTTWQGWILILLAMAVLCLYSIFDINVKILYSETILEGKHEKTSGILKKAILAFRKFARPEGFLMILYVAVVVPLVGIGITTRLTENLKIPDFIMAAILSNRIYLILYTVFLIFMFVQGLRYLFAFHAVVLDGMPVKEGTAHARKLMKEHWKNFIPHYFLFGLIITLSVIAVSAIFTLIPYFIVEITSPEAVGSKFFSIFLALELAVLFYFFYQMLTPLIILELTRYYRIYTDGRLFYVPEAPGRRHYLRILPVAVIIAVLIVSSGVMSAYYDDLFPLESTVNTIAHRTGGTLAFENSVEGIDAAAEYGAAGCETDVQRTRDGQYIINHDNDFSRLYGVNKKPYEMTMDEISRLRTSDGEKVPTLIELLERSKADNVKLYIELKGKTADSRMVDDVVRIIKEEGMVEKVALISLKYDVVAYAEEHYPEFETGYLYFMGYGNTINLDVDDLIIEEQLATGANISALKAGGKKVIVWTVNDKDDMTKILAGDADGIITDQVKMAFDIKEDMKKRDNIARALDRIQAWLY